MTWLVRVLVLILILILILILVLILGLGLVVSPLIVSVPAKSWHYNIITITMSFLSINIK
jgi:hypothetical protein